MESKWFAESGPRAQGWGTRLYGGEPFRVIQAVVPRSAADSLLRDPRLDFIGPARWADSEALDLLNQVTEISEWLP